LKNGVAYCEIALRNRTCKQAFNLHKIVHRLPTDGIQNSIDTSTRKPRLLEIEGYTMSAVSGSWLGVTPFEDKSN